MLKSLVPSLSPLPLTNWSRLCHERRLVVVDIENVLGGPVNCPEDARMAHTMINAAIPIHDDPVVIGTSHYSALEAGLGWPSHPRLVVRSGKDGADLALIEVLTSENIADRFGQLLLVTGDHIFAPAVSTLSQMGMKVTVASRRTALSRRLAMAAHRVVMLDNLPARSLLAA